MIPRKKAQRRNRLIEWHTRCPFCRRLSLSARSRQETATASCPRCGWYGEVAEVQV